MTTIIKKSAIFESVSVGDMFIYNDELFLCIKPIPASAVSVYNAISIESGLPIEINPHDPIKFCNTTITCIKG